jgi:hypothetical protein
MCIHDPANYGENHGRRIKHLKSVHRDLWLSRGDDSISMTAAQTCGKRSMGVLMW